MIKVSIIEDDEYIRSSVTQFLQMQHDMHFVAGFGSVRDFLTGDILTPDVLLLDIELPEISGLEGAFMIKQKFPDINILMLTVYEEKERVFKALQAGATGYLLKNTPLNKIRTAIIEAKDGGVPMSPIVAKKVIAFFADKPALNKDEVCETLTEREFEIAQLLVKGDTYKQIAYVLFISPDTVRQHIKNIYRKLQINSRVQLINEIDRKKAG